MHIALTATNLPKMPVNSLEADLSSEVQGNGQAQGTANFKPIGSNDYAPTMFLVTNKTFYQRSADTDPWNNLGEASKIYDPAVILDQNMGLAHVIRSVQNPTVEGKDNVNGVAVVKLSGTIDAAIIDPLVPTLGPDGGQLPITLYIQDVAPPASSSTTTSLESNAPNPGTGPNLVRFMVKKDQGSGEGNVQVTFSNWNKPVTIATP